MTLPIEKRTKQELSLALYQQAEDEAYPARGRAECEHIWEKVAHEIFQCFACGDHLDLRNWMDRH